MARFVCKFRDSKGREIQDTREAPNEDDIIARLQNEGYLVVSVTREQAKKVKKKNTRRLHPGINTDDLILFTRQLSTLLEAGVTLLKALEVLTKQIESKKLLEVTEELKHDISTGSTFRDALAKHPRVFSDFWVHIVETGEASGALPVTLAQLAAYLEAAAAMRRKVTSALIYPAILVVLSFVALLVFTVWIIPIFSGVFENFNVELPLLTIMVMSVSTFLRKNFLYMVLVAAVLACAGHKYIQTDNGRMQFDRLLLKIPVLASLFQQIALERFASGLGTLIESGVPILYGLDIINKAVGNKVLEEAITEVRESVRAGKGMTQPLEKNEIFTPIVVQMVSVGEEIGELGSMLRKVSEFYKERIATTLDRITTLIEPIVLILMGIVVGVMVIAMFLPIFQLAMLAK